MSLSDRGPIRTGANRATTAAAPPSPNYLLGFVAGYMAMLSVTDPSILTYSPVVALMGIIWLTQLPRGRVARTDLFMLLWSLMTWASGTWSLSPSNSQIAVSTQIGTLAIFLLIRGLADRPKMLVMAGIGFLIGCLREADVLYQAAGFSLRSGFGEERVGLAGLNQNYLAYSLTVALLIVVWLWGKTHRVAARTLLIGASVVCLLGINTAGTRAALLGIIAFGVWLIVAHRVVRRRAMTVLASIAGVLAVLAYTGLADAILAGQVQRGSRDTGDLNGRLGLWPRARDLIDEHPWAGIGAGAFRAMNPGGLDTHNAVLEVAVGAGLIGLALFTLTLFHALIVDTRGLPFSDRAVYAGGLIVLIMPIMLSGHWHQAPALWVAIAIISTLSRDPAQFSPASTQQVEQPTTRQRRRRRVTPHASGSLGPDS